MPVAQSRLTVSDDPSISVLHDAEQRWPSHQIVQVEADVIVLGQWVKVGEVEGEKVHRTRAANVAHLGNRMSIPCSLSQFNSTSAISNRD